MYLAMGICSCLLYINTAEQTTPNIPISINNSFTAYHKYLSVINLATKVFEVVSTYKGLLLLLWQSAKEYLLLLELISCKLSN